MLALSSLGLVINICADSSAADLWQFSVDVKGESTELADVDGVTTAESLVKVGDETTPDDQHLYTRVTQHLNQDLLKIWAQEAFS